MRMRFIKPGICSNEDIVAIGPYGYILFTGLWMLADRDGRFEWRPERIKALVMPLWSDIDGAAVENLLENLWKKSFIHRYEVDGKSYGQVVKWKKHQRPDAREAKSDIPPPPLDSTGSDGHGNYAELREVPRNSAWVMGNGYMGIVNDHSSSIGSTEPDDETPPPKPNPDPDPDPKPKPEWADPPDTWGDPDAPPEPPPRPVASKRKTPTRATPRPRKPPARSASRGPVDFWPHQPADVAALRSSLVELAGYVGLPPPDDAILLRILDAARGRTGADIHAVLCHLYKRERLREMRSWGLLPVMVSQWFRAA